jgi:L-ascorbate metabolism protein UlaG (beta-lactamase superfamily)
VSGAPFDGRRFRNEDPGAVRGLRDVLRWALTRRPQAWPKRIENRVQYRPRQPRPGEILFTFVNHSTFLIQHASKSVLTDPVWVRRASPVQWLGPARVREPGIPFDDLPHVDVVLVSHSHYDHMDLGTLRRLQQRFGSRIVTTRGNKAFLERRGLRDVTELDWWECVDGITATPAQHFAARTPFDRNKTLWAGFSLTLDGRRVFFTGDSGYSTHFARIGARFGPFDAALVPIGAYEPRWFMSAHHLNPDEAVRAHLDLRSRLSIAMHFGCFRLTDEGIDEPVRQMARALEHHAVSPSTFRVLEPGETLAV